jgi:hypothetical protein
VQNNSAEEKIGRASRPFLFGFTLFFSCALASFAGAQTSFSRLVGGSAEPDEAYLRWRFSEGTFPGTMTVNPSGTLVGAGVFAGRHWVSHSRDNPGAVTLAPDYGNPFLPTFNSRSELTEESAFGREITPVSEPGTCIAAALAAALLIWKRRKSLMALFNAISTTRARMRLAPDENVA